MVLVVLRIELRVPDFCVVSGLISLNSWLFLWLSICGLAQVLFLSLVVSF